MENSRWRQKSDVRCEDRWRKESKKVIITREINFQQFVNHFSDHSVRAVPFRCSFPSFALIMDIRIAVAWRRRRPAHHIMALCLSSLYTPTVRRKQPRRKRREISVRIRREIMTATYKAGRTPINSINQISECEVENYFVAFGKTLSELHLKVNRSRFGWRGAPRCLSGLAVSATDYHPVAFVVHFFLSP